MGLDVLIPSMQRLVPRVIETRAASSDGLTQLVNPLLSVAHPAFTPPVSSLLVSEVFHSVQTTSSSRAEERPSATERAGPREMRGARGSRNCRKLWVRRNCSSARFCHGLACRRMLSLNFSFRGPVSTRPIFGLGLPRRHLSRTGPLREKGIVVSLFHGKTARWPGGFPTAADVGHLVNGKSNKQRAVSHALAWPVPVGCKIRRA